MLELYKDGQPIFYNMVNNAIKNSKLSHAYIFDSNGNPDVMDIVLSFVKEIICMDITDDNNIKNICKRIDDGNYVDVKVIKSDGMWIKKDQLLDLQSEFNNKAFEGNKKIYIIRSAEKMNVQTANSILKFLEEPVDDIIAILITDNINMLLPTIISRCQVIKLNKKKCSYDTISNLSDLLISYGYNDISDDNKEKIINDVIRYKSGLKILFFNDYEDNIIKIANMNDIDVLCDKIKVLNDTLNNIKYNLNINLLIDKLVIDMCGDNS